MIKTVITIPIIISVDDGNNVITYLYMITALV